MANTAYATYQTTVALGKEVTRSTSVAPSMWAKVKAPKYKPEPTIIEDMTLQGSAVSVYQQTLGLRYDSEAWDSMPYLDTFPNFVLAELGSPDTLATAPTNTTLNTGASAGAMTISTAGTVAAGSWITIGSGATMEAHYTTAVTTTGFTVTLQYPLLYAQSSGATVTGLTGHDFSLLNNAGTTGNQPPSYTLYDFDGEEWRMMTGAQLDKLTIKGSGTTWVEFSCNWFADPSTTPANQNASFTTTLAPPGWTTLVAIGGTQVKYVEDWEIDLSRGVKPIPALTGNQGYYEYFAGPLAATAKLTLVEQATSPQITNFLNSAQQSLDITCYDKSSGFGMRLHSTLVAWKSGEIVRGKEWVEVTVEATLLPTTTDATAGGVSPINISIGNATASAY